ncbi:hypothetical protein BDV95DRAFT_598624 [Massariosphaeria phaeospora]|uniref:PAC domain-containing protein n=1 Tax=Massariosphaeria phaeospora TaxID=100035 RepID=A0A7C8M8Q8_9PLEO|nr:hypothetical protein BDV95DRAFT_598624 [Massariosphaeria phaeospora]
MSELHFDYVTRRASSPTLSAFAPSKILTPPPINEADDSPLVSPTLLEPPSGFSIFELSKATPPEELFDPRTRFSTVRSYDLRPPPPTVSYANAERLAERLFATDHLHTILKDSSSSQRFTAFLNRYRPQAALTLVRYLQSQKAITAVQYANSLAEQISPQSRHSSKNEAAAVDAKFNTLSRGWLDELVTSALPAYITYSMVSVVTECLVKEITGTNTPMMKDLVQGLAEVYCMTDPSRPDNPIVFASEEFYTTTQYGREYVIGKNCRFLQGPKTQRAAVKRITQAIQNGQELSEILLNYRRDGSPFLNLVMMAPLMDHKGNVRYYIGCQIDISHLIEDGRGLESFKRLVAKDLEVTETATDVDPVDQNTPLKILRELGERFNDEEMDIIRNRNRRKSIDSIRSTASRAATTTRRFVGMDDLPGPNVYASSHLGPSGKLPGVYQNYLLIRPYPSLRIIFTSAALRIPGLSQSRLMDRIGGPQHVRDGLVDALAQGVGVTAKISWLPQASRQSATTVGSGSSADEHDFGGHAGNSGATGKPRWIHCTPLMGSDSKPGVIMVVMVDGGELLNGSLNRAPPPPMGMGMASLNHPSSSTTNMLGRSPLHASEYAREDWPLRGMMGAASAKFTSAKLYADYLRREGRVGSGSSVEGGGGGAGGGGGDQLGRLAEVRSLDGLRKIAAAGGPGGPGVNGGSTPSLSVRSRGADEMSLYSEQTASFSVGRF